MAIFNSYVKLPEGSSCCLSTRVDTLPGMMKSPVTSIDPSGKKTLPQMDEGRL